MRVAVVGGGWAGLSAAVTAVGLGHDVRLFESAAVLGGRARSVHAPALETDIDNGQHILLGAYTATLALMRDLGLDPARRFVRLPLSVRSADGTLDLRAPPGLPAPLHVAAGLLAARGLSWKEKLSALRAMTVLRRSGWKTPRGATVQEWLSLTLQPPRLRALLWAPLCIATLNTPVEQACAQLFAHVLRDSLGASRRGVSDMLIPRTTLSELWPARVEELARSGAFGQGPHGASSAAAALEIHRSTTIRRLRYTGTGPSMREETGGEGGLCAGMPAGAQRLVLDDRPEAYDAVLLCGNTPSTSRLLATLPAQPGGDAFLDDLRAFEHAPIATLTLELERSFVLPSPMLLLHEDRHRGHFGQWLFQGQDAGRRLLHVVVSDADALLQWERSSAVAGMVEQLREQLRGHAMPAVLQHALIVEKRATFLAVPDLRRPGNRTPWPGVWVAGDWTDTGYPAVLEGAVRSGRDAARAMHASFSGASLGS